MGGNAPLVGNLRFLDSWAGATENGGAGMRGSNLRSSARTAAPSGWDP